MRAKWKIAHDRDLERLSLFLKKREWECVSFSGHLLERGVWTLPRRYKKRVFLFPNGTTSPEIAAAVLQTAGGFVYPVFGIRREIQPGLVASLVRELQGGFGTVSTIMGIREDVAAVEKRMPSRPHHVIDYDLLCLAPDSDPEILRKRRPSGGVAVRRATIEDLPELLPLQEAYEREEVLLPGRLIDRGITQRMLRRSIERQLVLLATLGGRIVAKASTNARGGRYDQIGGVFTLPEYRQHGIGGMVVSALTRIIYREGRGISLFVKKNNVAAQRLYAALGFAHFGDLRISYFA